MDCHGKLGGKLLAGLTGLVLGAACVPLSASGGETPAFADLFEAARPEEIGGDVFTLVGKEWSVITAGAIPEHNSMVASFGGFGILFEKPAAWCFLRANRYTLEKIRAGGTFTLSYFPERYRNDILLFGGKSGRDSNKMKESALTPLSTPDGLPAYAESRLVVELRLLEITTVSPDDFFTREGRDFVVEAHTEAKDYHKIVFGEIVKVWRKRQP